MSGLECEVVLRVKLCRVAVVAGWACLVVVEGASKVAWYCSVLVVRLLLLLWLALFAVHALRSALRCWVATGLRQKWLIIVCVDV